MFEFVVRYLSFLRHIPLLPHVFEAMLKIDLFIRNRALLNNLDDLETEVLSWNGVDIQIHRYGGTQFNLHNKEIGHLHGNGMLDILFNKKIKTELLQTSNIREHHTFKNSGWISFSIQSTEDKKTALSLLQQAYRLKSTSL
jgi:predicted DNA-binding protein (MmcQ/YjbR family)